MSHVKLYVQQAALNLTEKKNKKKTGQNLIDVCLMMFLEGKLHIQQKETLCLQNALKQK